MPSENSDQSGSCDQMIQKNHTYIISVSPEKSDLHLFFYFNSIEPPLQNSSRSIFAIRNTSLPRI